MDFLMSWYFRIREFFKDERELERGKLEREERNCGFGRYRSVLG